MEMTFDSRPAGDGAGPITILRLAGELDATRYLDVIERVRQLHSSGVRRLLIDLSQLTFLSSAGLVALHSTALIMRGRPLPDLEEGWNVFHAISNDVEASTDAEAALRLRRYSPVANRRPESRFRRHPFRPPRHTAHTP